MAFNRRGGGNSRFAGAIWPGFVDAITALLMVMIFVLTIFMVVQYVLREQITNQDDELNELNATLNELSETLGLEQSRADRLQQRVGTLTGALSAAEAAAAEQEALIAVLTSQTQQQAIEIASFEEQVASLLAENRSLGAARDAAQADAAEALSAVDALDLALAAARSEIDAAAEAARLAAARREALEALVADLQSESATQAASLAQALAALQQEQEETARLATVEAALADTQIALSEEEAARLAEAAAAAALRERLGSAQQALSDEEAARLAEATAAAALRERLADAQDELTAMTLALEEQRRRAEETLTLLAAADAVEDDLAARLAAALGRAETGENLAATLEAQLAAAEAEIDALEGDVATRVVELSALEEGLALALSRLESAEASAAARLAELRARIAQAEAQVTQTDAELIAREADLSVLEAQLAEALAARLATEASLRDALSVAEQRAALLAQANRELDSAETTSAESARQVTLLNEQVAALRSQLGSLQALLDDAADRDAQADVQISSLGTQLNTALAQLAAESSARAALEAAEAERLAAEAEELERYRSEFFGRLRELLEGRDGVRIDGDRFVFSSEVLFEVGSATLADEGLLQIERVARLLSEVSDDIPDSIDWIIRVDGHTDDQQIRGGGDFANNWELSQARALSVVLYMSEELGISPTRLAATGFGEYNPVASNDTALGRAANRRIELKLTER